MLHVAVRGHRRRNHQRVLVRRGGPPVPLNMFPRIESEGYELWFHSNWLNDFIQVIEADNIEPCPAGQCWPKCLWCDKFHLPPEGEWCHRESNTHKKFRKAWMDPIMSQSGNMDYTREKMMQDLHYITKRRLGQWY